MKQASDGDFSVIVACPECLHAVRVLVDRPGDHGRSDIFGRSFYGATYTEAASAASAALERLRNSLLPSGEWARLYGEATFYAVELP